MVDLVKATGTASDTDVVLKIESLSTGYTYTRTLIDAEETICDIAF